MNKKKILIIGGSIVVVILAIIIAFTVFNKKETVTYNVSFETNGGTSVKTQVINEGDKVEKPEDPKKDGYIFVEWIYEGETYDFSFAVTSDLELKAKWTKEQEDVETYIIKFDSDGGTTIPNQIIEKGKKVEKPEDPKKDNYKFVEWQLNGVKYDFESEVTSDLELKAVYEEIKSVNKQNTNTNSNKKPTSNKSNNTSSSTTIKISTPTLTEYGKGGSAESWGISYTVKNISEADGIEIYKSTTGSNYKLEKTLTKKQLTQQNNRIETIAYIGEHNYYKVRAYKTVSGKKVYSDYSKVVDVKGPTLSVPTLTEDGRGVSPESSGISYIITDIEFADGIEIYKSTTGSNYELEKTLTKTQLSQQNNAIEINAYIGEHNYYKIRAYKTVNGKKVYSNYSKVVDVKGPTLSVPTLTEYGKGGSAESWGISYTVTDIEFADGIEIYKSTTGSNYELEKTLTKTQLSQQDNRIETIAYVGEHNYYKVRAYKTVNGKKVYSNYSDIVDVTGPTG